MTGVNRRDFLKLSTTTLIGITLGGVSLRVNALEHLTEDDPTAAALKYIAKSTTEGAQCANCAYVQGDAGAQWRPCAIFPGKQVNAEGWCSAWMKKPS